MPAEELGSILCLAVANVILRKRCKYFGSTKFIVVTWINAL